MIILTVHTHGQQPLKTGMTNYHNGPQLTTTGHNGWEKVAFWSTKKEIYLIHVKIGGKVTMESL